MSFCPKYVRVGCAPVTACCPSQILEKCAYLDDVEELRDDRRDPAEERRARPALHLVAIALDLDERAFLLVDALYDAAWIHLADCRHEDRCGAAAGDGEGGEQLEVARERARVCREVFVGRKLGGVHEDREYGEVVLG